MWCWSNSCTSQLSVGAAIEGDEDEDGESEPLGLREALGLSDAELDIEADRDGDSDVDGEREADALGLMEADGDRDGDADGDSEVLGDIDGDADGLIDAEADRDGEALGDVSVPGFVTSRTRRPSILVATFQSGNVPVTASAVQSNWRHRTLPAPRRVSVIVPGMSVLPRPHPCQRIVGIACWRNRD